MTPRNQCGHCGRGGGEPRPWQDRFDLLCWSCNGWLVERERAERAEAALARVRELCDEVETYDHPVAWHTEIRAAIEEGQ